MAARDQHPRGRLEEKADRVPLNWSTFFSVFGLVFFAELGDKTQLAVITQVCRCRRPWTVFAGASAALFAVTGVGVFAGQLLGQLMPIALLRTAAAGAFAVMGLLMAIEAVRMEAEPTDSDGGWACDGEPDTCATNRPDVCRWTSQAFGATFGLLFLAELGDKTQLAVLTLSSSYSDAWAVLGGAGAALTAVTGLGVIGGRVLCAILPRRTLLLASSLIFIGMAGWLGLSRI